ncbi:MAG: DUF4832 domain-containing protein, partial [Thermoanaerobacterium sp.]|nr:DUF4832 domain-containing protein [Thermoanaerobacterium sp.]
MNISVDGKIDDWSLLEPLYKKINKSVELYAAIKNGKLYMMLKGDIPLKDAWNDIFIDVDNNSETGYKSWAWPDLGADYLVENGILYKHSGAGWSWEEIATSGIEYVYGDVYNGTEKVTEMSISLKDIGGDNIKSIRLAFNSGDIYLPESNNYTKIVPPSMPQIIVDGGEDDWVMVKPIAEGQGRLKLLKAIRDGNRLNVLVKGELGETNGIFLDVDDNVNTGSIIWAWPNNGADYLILNGKVYKSTGPGWAWELLPGIKDDWIVKGDVLEASIDLSVLENVNDNMKLAVYIETPETFLPEAGTKMVKPLSSLGVDIIVDGNDDEWNVISHGVFKSDTKFKLYAVEDDRKLYIRIDGSKLNSNNIIYIDTNKEKDNYDTISWEKGRANYKIERTSLYKYNNGEWTRLGRVNVYIESEKIEYEVNLKQLELEKSSNLKIAVLINNAIYIPALQEEMAMINTFIYRDRDINTFYPYEIFEVLNNPYMGFVSWAKAGDTGYEQTLAYVGLSWREIEPQKGKYAWDEIEKRYLFDEWTKKGVKLVLRIYLDEPRPERSGKENLNDLDIPVWLYNEIGGDGTWYYKEEIGGGGFSPNYSNEKLIINHERLIKALGERYNNDPRIAFIQLGSLGHWGEWHTWPLGSGEFPTTEVSDKYVEHYIKYFPNKIIGMRKPFDIAADNKIGLYNDMFGDKGATEEWINWFTQGRYDEYNGEYMKPMPDFWKYAYSGGEFAFGNALMFLTDDKIADTLRLARMSHTSFLGPSSPLDIGMIDGEVVVSGEKKKPLPDGHPIKENIDILHKTMGYRFVLESFSHNKYVKQGEKLNIKMVWNNRGIAPFYYKWPIQISLANTKGDIIYSWNLEEDIRKWLPGIARVDTDIVIPKDIAPGEYTFLISINDPTFNKPGIKLAIDGMRGDGRYTLDKFVILPASASKPEPTLPAEPTEEVSQGKVVVENNTTTLTIDENKVA